jgi:hypothetical protein
LRVLLTVTQQKDLPGSLRKNIGDDIVLDQGWRTLS